MTKRKINPMSADALATYMATHNLSCAELAARLDVEPDEVWRWLGEQGVIPDRVTLKIRSMERSRRALAQHAKKRRSKARASKGRR